jgi:hypothetical protein
MLDEHVFPYRFDGVKLLVDIKLCKVHSAESTSTNLLLDIKVV